MLGGNVKIVSVSDEKFILYLNQTYLDELDFDHKTELESYFKILFSKLKMFYEIEMRGYYHITCYTDDYYGMILSIEKEDVEYFDYLDSQVDMRIVMEDDQCFLYQVYDMFAVTSEMKKRGTLYQYKKKYYYKVNEPLPSISFGRLLEHADIVFEDTLQILKYGKKVVW